MVGRLDQRPAVIDLGEPVVVRQLVSEVDRQRRLGGSLALLLDLLDGAFGIGESVDGEDADGAADGELVLRAVMVDAGT